MINQFFTHGDTMEEKFSALNLYAGLCIILGWLVIILPGGFSIIVFFRTLHEGFTTLSIIPMVFFLVFGIALIAFGELARLMIALEENTRVLNPKYKQISPQIKTQPPKSNDLKDANCPKCNTEINSNYRECPNCKILFGPESFFKPKVKAQQFQTDLKPTLKREQPLNPNAKCPVCKSLVKKSDYDCWNCNAIFAGDSTYKPIDL